MSTDDDDDVVIALAGEIEEACIAKDASVNDALAALFAVAISYARRPYAGQMTNEVRVRMHSYLDEVWAVLEQANVMETADEG